MRAVSYPLARRLMMALIMASVLLLADVPAHSATKALEGTWKMVTPRASLLSANDALPEFTEAGRKLYAANQLAEAKGDYEAYDLTMARCSAPGIPRVMLTPNRFRIFVRPDVINVIFEWNRLLRQINLRDMPRDPDWGTVTGQSWGHWQGEVLVIESRGFSRKRLLDNLLPNSDALTVVERLRLKDRNTLEDRITINDPKIFVRPWEAVVLYKRTADEVFPEDVCLDRKAAGQLPLPKD